MADKCQEIIDKYYEELRVTQREINRKYKSTTRILYLTFPLRKCLCLCAISNKHN
jgi:hypothetical protein